MKKQILGVLLIAIVVVISNGFGQMQPIITGAFPKTGPAATIILVNQSSLTDEQLARVANSLTQRVANVAVATRLSGTSCYQGEWCLPVTNELLGYNADSIAAGAALGAEVTRSIVSQVVQR